MTALRLARRIIRPLVPDWLMARLRLHQVSRHSRNNVDVHVAGKAQARRWLAATPDTYRAVLGPVPESHVPYATAFDVSPGEPVVLAAPGSESEISVALGALAGADAAVVGRCRPPRLVDRRRAEPAIVPLVVAVSGEAAAGIPGLAQVASSLPATIEHLRAAGARFALVPRPVTGEGGGRRDDPIGRDPWVVLSAVPMHDVGGGSRGAQIALELLRRDAHVVHVALYGAQESADLGIRFVDSRLEQSFAVGFAANGLAARCDRPGTAIVEAPAPELASIAVAMKAAGWSTVYDVIDDWSDPALGGPWYSESVERDLVRGVDAVIASAPDLVKRAAAMGRQATLVPNAVNSSLFAGDHERPADIGGDPIIGYHGSLYGDWFDWEALGAVAAAFPEMRVVVIGDERPHPRLPDNVTFLGLKPQIALPGYLQAMAVGVIPFRVGEATHAVSPLKAFEYLASGVPVAAPPLRALAGLDGVHTDPDLVAAVRRALAAPRPDRSAALAEHSWERRVDDIYRALGRRPAPIADGGADIRLRPAVRYRRRDRLVRR